LLFCLIAYQTYSQTFKEKEIKTEIAEVTVSEWCSNLRNWKHHNTSGKTILSIRNLSPFIDEKSIQVKATGDFTILSVNHKFNYLSELKKDKKIDSLSKIVETLESGVLSETARLEVLHEKQVY